MKQLKWYHILLIIVAVFVLILIFNEKARANFFYWWCNTKNKHHKVVGDTCTSCVEPGSKTPPINGIIDANGNCVESPAQIYAKCLADNASKPEATECDNCVTPPGVAPVSKSTLDGYVTQYKGVIIDGKCVALPDAFAGKICVPNNASVTPMPLSYKRVLQMNAGNAETENQAPVYKYFKTPSTTVQQSETIFDVEISKDDFIQAYVQTIKPCPVGQIKV